MQVVFPPLKLRVWSTFPVFKFRIRFSHTWESSIIRPTSIPYICTQLLSMLLYKQSTMLNILHLGIRWCSAQSNHQVQMTMREAIISFQWPLQYSGKTRRIIWWISAAFAEKMSITDAIVYRHLLRDGCKSPLFTVKRVKNKISSKLGYNNLLRFFSKICQLCRSVLNWS